MYLPKSIPFNKSRVHYFIQKSSKNAVVFCHGDGQNHTAGLGILALFPKTYTKIGIDRPGHGKSPMLANRTIGKECEIIERILEKENIKEVILVGHSSGAVIISSFALRKKIKALVLINPFFMNPRKVFWYLPIKFMEKIYLNKAKGEYNPKLPYHYFGKEKTEEEVHSKAFAHTPYEVLQQNLNLFEGHDIRKEMQKLGCPVLIVQSTKGLISTTKHVNKVSKDMQSAITETISGTHNVHLTSKKEVEKSIRRNLGFLMS